MLAVAEEYSACRRFRLVRLPRADGSEGIRLELAASATVALDLGDERAVVEGCCFDAGGRPLLHLRLSRADRSLVMYPATLDLERGVYYHGEPRAAHAPAGRAEDLEAIARGAGPCEFDPAAPVRWPEPGPVPFEAAAASEQGATTPPVVIEPAEPPGDPRVSSDGAWRLESFRFEDGPEGYDGHARILETASGRAVLDCTGSNWYSRARFNPVANQLWIRFQHADGRRLLDVFVDLDCLLYWETDAEGRFLPGGRLAASLAELQARLCPDH